jgi:cation diffusion facilitator CzcD-associated flavoprotein CzcO
MHPVNTLVIGAGQAGLAAGYHLPRAGHSFTILGSANKLRDKFGAPRSRQLW